MPFSWLSFSSQPHSDIYRRNVAAQNAGQLLGLLAATWICFGSTWGDHSERWDYSRVGFYCTHQFTIQILWIYIFICSPPTNLDMTHGSTIGCWCYDSSMPAISLCWQKRIDGLLTWSTKLWNVSGILTRELISYHFRNTVEGMCDGEREYCKKLYYYLSENVDWIRRTVNKKESADSYWRQVGALLRLPVWIYHKKHLFIKTWVVATCKSMMLNDITC